MLFFTILWTFIFILHEILCDTSINEIFNTRFIQDLQIYFNAKWVIFQTCNKFEIPSELMAEFKNNNNLFISLYDWKDFIFYHQLGLYNSLYVKPLVFVSCLSCGPNCLFELNELNKYFIIKKFIWVVPLINDSKLSEIYFPLDSEFIFIKEINSQGIFDLEEIYQISEASLYHYNKIGWWSEMNGFDAINAPFEERRSNFFEENMTTFSLPPVTLYVQRLESLMNKNKDDKSVIWKSCPYANYYTKYMERYHKRNAYLIVFCLSTNQQTFIFVASLSYRLSTGTQCMSQNNLYYNSVHLKKFQYCPEGLELKYPLFFVEQFISISDRLNIRLKFTDQESDNYKFNLVGRPMSLQDPGYFYAIHRSKVILFFKDLVSEILLDSFIKPFHMSAWCAILFYVLIMTTSSHLINKTLNDRKSQLYQLFFDSVTILMQKYDVTNEVFISQRIIKISQWVTSITLYLLYSAVFISYVTVILRTPPFSNIDDILADGRYNVVVHGLDLSSEDSFVVNIFWGHSYITQPLGQRLREDKLRQLFELHFYQPLNNVPTMSKAIKLMCYTNDLYVILHAHDHYETAKEKHLDCPISNSYISLHSINLAWPISYNSPYKRVVNYFLLKLLQSGSIMNLYKERTKAKLDSDLNLFSAIELEQVVFVLICVSAGVILSILIFILERHFYRLSEFYKSYPTSPRTGY